MDTGIKTGRHILRESSASISGPWISPANCGDVHPIPRPWTLHPPGFDSVLATMPTLRQYTARRHVYIHSK